MTRGASNSRRTRIRRPSLRSQRLGFTTRHHLARRGCHQRAIVLIDWIQLDIDAGRDAASAAVEPAQRRLRPIPLTTGTTIGGLVPLYLGGGPMREPMAVAILFGLAFATVLALGVVPVLSSILYRASHC